MAYLGKSARLEISLKSSGSHSSSSRHACTSAPRFALPNPAFKPIEVGVGKNASPAIVCRWQSRLLEMSERVVDRLHTGSGLNKQRAVCILLENPGLEDPQAHRYVPLDASRCWPTRLSVILGRVCPSLFLPFSLSVHHQLLYTAHRP